MLYERAREILDSEDSIRVLYKGSPVWIEGLSRDGKKADVKMDAEFMEVPVRELIEG